MPDYKEVVDVVESLGRRSLVIGEVLGYPLYVVHINNNAQNMVLLSGGIHGDEIAGVYSALKFMREKASSYDANFLVFPCMNPTGFVKGKLENYAGENLNRLWGQNCAYPEIRYVENFLSSVPRSYAFTFGMHETDPFYEDHPEWGGTGFPTEPWLYEQQEEVSKRIGHLMVDELPQGTPVCDWPTIYDDINLHGVISYPEGCMNPVYLEGTTFEGFLPTFGFTKHAFTTETPKGWELEKRVNVHLSFLDSALRHLIN